MEIVLMKHGVFFFVLAILVGTLSCDHHHKAEASSSLQNGTLHLSNCSHGSSLWGGCRRDPVVEDDDDVEFLMDSDTGRRILAAAKHNYVTYGAENRNKPVCRGSAAYRSCLPPPHTAPRRGCQKVYKCRSPPSP